MCMFSEQPPRDAAGPTVPPKENIPSISFDAQKQGQHFLIPELTPEEQQNQATPGPWIPWIPGGEINSGRTFSAEGGQGFYHVHGQSTDQATRIGWESIEWIGSFLTTGDGWSKRFFGANDGEVFSMLANVQLFLGKFLGLKWIVM